MRYILLMSMLIPCALFSQNISITLSKSQWNEIRQTIEQEEHLRGLVDDFKQALANSQRIEDENNKIIANLEGQIRELNKIIQNQQREINNLERIYDVDMGIMRDRANKRLSVGLSAGMGYGTASRNPQMTIGIGINYTIIRL